MLPCASLLLRSLPPLGPSGLRCLKLPLRLAGGQGLRKWSGRDEGGVKMVAKMELPKS
jgi:hypothetical protein